MTNTFWTTRMAMGAAMTCSAISIWQMAVTSEEEQEQEQAATFPHDNSRWFRASAVAVGSF